MGFRVDRLLARIGADEQRPRPRTHMTLHVHAGEQSWLADVGFGAGLLQPLPWGDTGTHRDGGWTYQLTGEGRTWRLWEHGELGERQPGGWAVLYSFSEEPQHLSDVVMSNHFTSTHPSSPFVTQIIAMRKDPEQRRRLAGRRLSVTRPDGATDERELSDTEVAVMLREEFRIRLDDEEMASLVGSLPPASG
jgi:N-hydroxyarylamine O-acetyltransferase